MGYNATTGVISAPIGLAEEADVLSCAEDVVTCSMHHNVNKWSKHKPVRGVSPEEITTWYYNTGNVDAPVGYAPVWALILPWNTYQQLGSPWNSHSTFIKPLAYRASGRSTAGNVQNYIYLAPRLGTDFGRMTDFNGYNSNAPAPWSAHVSGASDYIASNGTNIGQKITIDTFDNAEITFAFGRPSNSDIGFCDLFGHSPWRFVVELYKNDASLAGENDTPEAILVSTKTVSQFSSDYGQTMTARVSRLQPLVGNSFIAVLGVNSIADVSGFPAQEYGVLPNGSTDTTKPLGYYIATNTAHYNKISAGSGSIPPWTPTSKTFICNVEFASYSKIDIQVTGFAAYNSTSYMATPTNPWTTDDRPRFKATVYNKGTSAIILNAGTTSGGVKPIFRIRARGSYDTTANNFYSMCDDAYNSKWRTLNVRKTADMSGTSAFTIAASGNAVAYFQTTDSLLPKGTTNGFTVQVSTDGGATWVITASFSGTFVRN